MKHVRGFTLIELMIGIAVAAILATIAVPSFTRLIQSTRLNTQTTELLSALLYARTEALKRNINVSICHTANPAAAAPACNAAANGWGSGWIVFTDAGTAGAVDAGTDVVLRVGQPTNTMTFDVPTRYNNWLGFTPTGLPRAAGNGMAVGTIRICTGVLRRSIVISGAGRMQNEILPDNADCGAIP